MAGLTRKDIRDAGPTGIKIDGLIGIIVSKANKTRLDDNSFSLASMLSQLRTATNNNEDTFASIDLPGFKGAFFPASLPNNVVQEYLDICCIYERIITFIETEAAGLPENNV